MGFIILKIYLRCKYKPNSPILQFYHMLRISFILNLALQERYVVEEFEIFTWSLVYFRIQMVMVVAIALVLLFPMVL